MNILHNLPAYYEALSDLRKLGFTAVAHGVVSGIIDSNHVAKEGRLVDGFRHHPDLENVRLLPTDKHGCELKDSQ